MWGLGQVVNYPDRAVLSETDPLGILLDEGFSREAIMKTGNDMFQVAHGDWLSDPLSNLEKAILRVCVENSTWVTCYVEHSPSIAGQAKATLRSLAAKLEAFDIEVNFIPAD